MHSHKILSYCNRYSILKPNNQILMLRNKLEAVGNQSYLVAKSSEISIRKYHRYCQNLQNLLGLAEWRLQAPEEVAHWYYIQLGKPKLGEKCFQFQLYAEHMDLLMKDMSKLITSESLYILVKALKGYQKLLFKFGKVSVNDQTIGMNCQGSVIVWLNRQLQSMTAESQTLENETQIINRLINLIKSRSEFASQNVLNSILEFAMKNGSNIKETLVYIQNCTLVNKINLACNLKYLVNRNKFILDLKTIENTNNLQLKISKPKMNRFPLARESKSKENFVYKYSKSPQEKSRRNIMSRQSKVNKNDFVRNVPQKSAIVGKKRRSFVQLFSSKISHSSKSNVKPRYSETNNLIKRSFLDHNLDSDSHYLKSLSKSREKNNIFIVNHLHNLESNRSISSKMAFSQRQMKSLNILKVSQTQTASSLLETQKCINRNNSLSKLQKPVHKSFISKFPLDCEKEKVQEQERQSCESSPQKDNKSNEIQVKKQPQRSLQMSFGFSSQKKQTEMILKENNWIKTLEGLLCLEAKMNNSILEGPDKNDYLSDVRLQKLDLLTRNMTQSLMPSTQLQVPAKIHMF